MVDEYVGSKAVPRSTPTACDSFLNGHYFPLQVDHWDDFFLWFPVEDGWTQRG